MRYDRYPVRRNPNLPDLWADVAFRLATNRDHRLRRPELFECQDDHPDLPS
jgi:hypothetical protein